MALTLAGSRFVGVDLSAAQIDAGRGVVRALGLENVTLEARSILDVGEELGPFDYVICHGVYSWVPAEVRERILAICARSLTPEGIGYVSYNTYPGWHLRGMVRDMMLFHVRGFASPRERVEQARAFLAFLVASARFPKSAFAAYLKEEAALLQETPDSYLFHEHLEEVNRPLYFHEFVERLAPHGLQYLGEALPTAIRPGEFPPEVEETVRRLAADVVQFEQYLDFLRNRTFRRTLVCRAGVALDRTWSGERLAALLLAAPVDPVSAAPALDSDDIEQFRGPGKVTLSISHPWLKTGLAVLGERWPEAVSFEALRALVGERLGRDARAEDLRYLRDGLLECYVSGLVELYRYVPRFVRRAGDRPLASPLARLQAETGCRLTSLRHRVVEVSALDREVLRLLDGSRDREALLDALASRMAAGGLGLHRDGEPPRDASGNRQALAAALEQSLAALGQGALLLA
jgi:methyltransferase-like protein